MVEKESTEKQLTEQLVVPFRHDLHDSFLASDNAVDVPLGTFHEPNARTSNINTEARSAQSRS